MKTLMVSSLTENKDEDKKSLPMPVVKILGHGQVTIPKKFREVLGLEVGDLAEAELKGEQIVITPKKLVEDKALRELKAVLAEVHSQNPDVSEEDVVNYARQAIAELRANAKDYAQHQKA